MLNKKLFAVLLIVASTASIAAQGKKAEAAATAETAKASEPAKAAEPVAKPAPVAEFKPLGFIGFAYAQGTYAITCGGPKFGFTYGPYGMAAGFYPSLVYTDANRNGASFSGAPGELVDPIRPALGAGLELSYGKIALIAPVYYLGGNARSAYYYTIGIGYKF